MVWAMSLLVYLTHLANDVSHERADPVESVIWIRCQPRQGGELHYRADELLVLSGPADAVGVVAGHRSPFGCLIAASTCLTW